MTKLTKAQKLRHTRDYSFRIIQSHNGRKYILIPRDKMVCVRVTEVGEVRLYNTFHTHSLSWVDVRKIFRKRSGRLRYGWDFLVNSARVKIGCQYFTGDNYNALLAWSEGR